MQVPNIGQMGAASQTGMPALRRVSLGPMIGRRGPGLKRKPALDPKLARIALVAGMRGPNGV